MKLLIVFVLALAQFGIGSGRANAQAQLYRFTTIAGLSGHSGSADGTNSNARFNLNKPCGIAPDRGGALYFADSLNHTIRKLTPVGSNWVSSTIAGMVGSPGSADGTNSGARFNNPNSVAIDNSGNLYVTDNWNHTIRKLMAEGTNWVSSTIAGLAGSPGSSDGTNSQARFNLPLSMAMDSSGNLYVADWGNESVRKLTLVGGDWVSSTIAGLAGHSGSSDGTNTQARFNGPIGTGADLNGSLYLADHYNFTIRKITIEGTNWVTRTIAGLPGVSGSADGTNQAARFAYDLSVAADSTGNLFVAENGNSTIRKLTQVGTNWVSSTIGGLAGNPGSADGTNSAARFSGPSGLRSAKSGPLISVH
jgi:hypothetical protein